MVTARKPRKAGRVKTIRPELRGENYKHDHRKRARLPKQVIHLYEYVQRDNHTYYMFDYEMFQCIIAHTDDGALNQGYYGFFFKPNDTYYYNCIERHKPYPDIQRALNTTILAITNVTHTRLRYKVINNVKYKIV